MTRIWTAMLCAGLAFGAAGCKIVKDKPEDQRAIASDASGDEQRISQLLGKTFEADVLGNIRDNAVDIAQLRQAVAGGIDEAGAQYGNRGAGAGAAWAFAVKGQGKVVSANMESRARVAELDTDGDGVADVTVQLGPVFKGTSLRDVSPIFVFTDFRDQIEYAKLARDINDRMKDSLSVPDADPTGKVLAFEGAVSLKDATDKYLVTPITVSVVE